MSPPAIFSLIRFNININFEKYNWKSTYSKHLDNWTSEVLEIKTTKKTIVFFHFDKSEVPSELRMLLNAWQLKPWHEAKPSVSSIPCNNQETWPFEIRANCPHTVKNHLKSRPTLWKLDHSKISRFQMFLDFKWSELFVFNIGGIGWPLFCFWHPNLMS